MRMTADAVIIGGGVIGCAIAESLASGGMKVTLVERGLIGHEASWAAAGMLAPQSEMAGPGPYMDFCLASRDMYPGIAARLRERTGIDPQHRDEGMFYVALTATDERTITERAAWQRDAGLTATVMSAAEVRSAEPAVTPSLRMAVHFAGDHQIDPRLLTRAYAISARMSGAELIEYAPVRRILIEGSRAAGVEIAQGVIETPHVILAAGSWSGLLPGLDEIAPVVPVKGQVLLLQCADPLFAHVMHSPKIYLVPRLDGRVVVGATEEHGAGYDKSVRAGDLTELLASAFEVVPDLRRAALADSWAGLRPGTPDRLAIIGRSPYDGLTLATGHFRNGILLAPITAARIADLIMRDEMADDLAPFACSRFVER